MSADKLASFRVDSQLWELFQGYAKENNVTATALLVAYIKSVVNTGSVITSNPVVNTSIEVNNPSLSLQDIDKRMDDKIQQSIHNINTLSLQDIDNRIAESIAAGDIRDAIASSYAGVMGQMNGLIEELQQLKNQLQELQSNPPAAAANDQLPSLNKNEIENIRTTLKRKGVQPITNDQIRKAFSDAGWNGKNYQELRQAVIDSLSRQNNDKVP